MDVNILIICITVAVCTIFAMATIAYAIDRRRKKLDLAVEMIATLIVQFAKEGVKGDE